MFLKERCPIFVDRSVAAQPSKKNVFTAALSTGILFV
jgi:hypothetical protein